MHPTSIQSSQRSGSIEVTEAATAGFAPGATARDSVTEGYSVRVVTARNQLQFARRLQSSTPFCSLPILLYPSSVPELAPNTNC